MRLLGMAAALGLTTVIGALGPPIFRGILGQLDPIGSSQVILFGIVVALVGIWIGGKRFR